MIQAAKLSIMTPSKFFSPIFVLVLLISPFLSSAANSKLFAEYIGAEYNSVTFSDVPINPNVNFHFILSFAIDYTTNNSPKPTDGNFNIFWNSASLSPSQVSSVKKSHGKVKFALSIGGDSVQDQPVNFFASSIDTWVDNAVSSLTKIIQEYNLDGIDIDYEHFDSDINTFVECIGKLLMRLKNNGVISFASIAPFKGVEKHYVALYTKYGNLIDYVNFQFYAYDTSTSVSQFLSYYDEQSSKYRGGKVLVSFSTGDDGGLQPGKGFFSACKILQKEGKLHGIFVFSADDTLMKNNGFHSEVVAQNLLASVP